MKRKVEDELIKLAFGDIEPNRSERAKRAVQEDAAAAELLASYAEIREGLKQLKTPEHQLSTERLRERILAEGLKAEKPNPFGWRWTLGSVAVAAAAMVITLRLTGSHAIPAVGGIAETGEQVGSLGATALNFSPSGDTREWMIKSAAQGSLAESVSPDPAPIANSERVEAPSPAPTKATLAVESREPKPSVHATKETSTSRPITPEEISSLALDGALPAGAVALHQDSWGEEPIVLIGAESDETTGANRAMEVSSPTNVVVGG